MRLVLSLLSEQSALLTIRICPRGLCGFVRGLFCRDWSQAGRRTVYYQVSDIAENMIACCRFTILSLCFALRNGYFVKSLKAVQFVDARPGMGRRGGLKIPTRTVLIRYLSSITLKLG